jgi:predicted transposase/invertase (TIGR01784 family)
VIDDEVYKYDRELLPPTEDGVFKTLLTGNDSEPVLRDIISSILQIPVIEVTVRNAEPPISDIDEKRERFDVNCLIDNGEQVDVELQTSPMRGDNFDNNHSGIKSRAIFNLCDLHSAQEGRGVSYRKLLRSFQITFCDYTVFPEREDFVNRFSFRNTDGDELLDAVGIIFIELSKLGAVLKKPVEEMTGIEAWSVYLSCADEPENAEVVRKLIETKEEIKLANDILRGISHDPDQRAKFMSRRRFQMDLDHDKAESFEEGKIEGKIEGILEGKLEIAKQLFARGMSVDEITKITGLTREEIEQLRKQTAI